MTSVAIGSPVAPAPCFSLSDVLAEPTLRHSLRAMVRRRVPAAEADDIVQATLCDALAAPRVPGDPTEIPRWLMAIARNKIADHFRRARREERVDVAPAQALHEPVEERSILRKIVSEAYETEAGRRTFEWVVREAAGEQLAEIAEEANLPPALVRQRVSRWRRRARSVFLLAAATLALALVAREVLTRTRSVSPLVTTAAPSRVAGAWRVVEADIPPNADPRLRALAAVSLSGSRLIVDGQRARFETLGLTIDRGFTLENAPNGATTLQGALTTEGGGSVPLEIRFDGDAAIVSGGGARFRLAR